MRKWALVLALAVLMVAPIAQAQSPLGLACAKSGMITRGGFLKDLCWSCFFPITIGGIRTSVGPLPGDVARGACLCPGRLGFPTPGITLGMWQPTHTITSTRNAFCFPELDLYIPSSGFNGASLSHAADMDDLSYRHSHVMMFPIDVIMDLFSEALCNSGSMGLDILFISEIDPTHNNEALSMLTTPEAFLVSSMPAQAACLADAVAATAAKPIRALFWCAGAWDNLYPLAGYRSHTSSAPIDAAAGMAKGAAMMHRRMLFKRTYGYTAVCKDHIDLMLPKQQYRYQSMYPLPSHFFNEWMGRSTLLGREARHLPGVGEDFVNILWTRQECCANF